jgi:phenylacetate-coenzyme A ligase PaaK-like adenylate-forming protein
MGTDCSVFRDKIEQLWGRKPLNVYGNTESCVIAAQTWDYQDMVFVPNLNFLEFIPEEEYSRSQNDWTYHPQTILLDEVQPGKNYELVISSFHGGIMVRYRLGEIVRITSLSNEKLGINLPQMEMEGRADDLIDLGFMRLNERVIWQALESTGIPYKEWTAHKEIRETPRLKFYIELVPGYYTSSQDIAERLYQAIKKLE